MTRHFNQAIDKMREQPEALQNKVAEFIELVLEQDYPKHSKLTFEQLEHVRDTIANGKIASDNDIARFKKKYGKL